jgi:hypothetical protein
LDQAKKFLFYLLRWQMSTPVLWLVVRSLGPGLEATVLANLIGGSIFFWVDRLIFRNRFHVEWEVQPEGTCSDCGSIEKVRRLTFAPAAQGFYDKREDARPEYRCPACSEDKIRQLRAARRVLPAVTA